MSEVGLIILAAGALIRMGTPKQLLRYGEQSLIRHVVQVAKASIFSNSQLKILQ
ncbi:NTP transferase domain-containing protein [uncultured Nostoc sp.]|uniref:NTP transferase domain-containing protein n=1 Tax=uncultured Nostoc sp. TaxID=340711 RepID=UPI0035CB283E